MTDAPLDAGCVLGSLRQNPKDELEALRSRRGPQRVIREYLGDIDRGGDVGHVGDDISDIAQPESLVVETKELVDLDRSRYASLSCQVAEQVVPEQWSLQQYPGCTVQETE